LIQKYQKIKTSTEIALEADLPCGKAKNSLRSNSWPFFSQGRSASTLRDGDFRKGRKDEKKERKKGLSARSPFLPAISGKKTVRRMENGQLTLRNPFV